jgi:hypothetical protein
MHHDHILFVIMSLLKVTFISDKEGSTSKTPEQGTVLMTDGGIDFTVTDSAFIDATPIKNAASGNKNLIFTNSSSFLFAYTNLQFGIN